MKYYAGVDGGGTKTGFALFDENKNMLLYKEGPGSNHENYEDGFITPVNVIIEGLTGLCTEYGMALSDLSFTLMGLAGIDHPWQHDKMCAMLREKGLDNFEIFNDGFIVVKAGSETGYAVGYNCGTGVCCNGIDRNGNMLQLMGLGRFSGDVSGGTDIAVKTFQMVYSQLFLNCEETMITELLFEKYGFTRREQILDLVGKIENLESEHIRNFIDFFFAAINAGDKVALDFSERMAERGAKSIAAIISSLDFSEEVEVVLSGSINIKLPNRPYMDSLKKKAEEYSGRRLKFINLENPPVTGCINWIMQDYAK